MTRTVFFVSDQTGITVQTLGEALLAHFPADAIERIDIPFIDSERKAQQVASRIRDTAVQGEPPIVLSSINDDHLRAVIRSSGVLCLDVLETFIAPWNRPSAWLPGTAPAPPTAYRNRTTMKSASKPSTSVWTMTTAWTASTWPRRTSS